MTQIREHLLSTGKPVSAVSLVLPEVELSTFAGNEVLVPFETSLSAMDTSDHKNWSLPTLVRTNVLRTFYGTKLAHLGFLSKAKQEFQHARISLENADVFSTRLQLLQDRQSQLFKPVPPSAKEKLEFMLSMNDRCKEIQDMVLSRFYQQCALEIAASLREEVPLEERAQAYKVHSDLLQTYADFEYQSMRCAFYIAGTIGDYGLSMVAEGASKSGSFMQLLLDFEHDFPDFDIPRVGQRLSRAMTHAASQNDDELQKLKSITKTENYMHNSNWMRRRNGRFEFKELDDQSSWLYWVDAREDVTRRKYNSIACELILRWARSELAVGILTANEAHELLQCQYWPGIPPPTLEQDLQLALLNFDPSLLPDILLGKERPVEATRFHTWFAALRTWLSQLNTSPSLMQRLRVLKEIQVSRSISFNTYLQTLSMTDRVPYQDILLNEARVSASLHQELHSMDPTIVSKHELLTSQFLVANTIVAVGAFFWLRDETGRSEALAAEARLIFAGLVKEYSARHELMNLCRTYSAMARLEFQEATSSDQPSKSGCLPYLESVDEIFREIRADNAVLNPSRAFAAKDALSRTLGISGSFGMGLSACVSDFVKYADAYQAWRRSPQEHEFNSAWDPAIDNITRWSQKLKARAVSDLLGLSAEVLLSMMDRIKDNEHARRALVDEQSLEKQVQNARALEKMNIQTKLVEHRKKMRDFVELASMLDLRDGLSLSAGEIRILGKELGPGVVIVDWFYSLGLEPEIFMMTYRDGSFQNLWALHGKNHGRKDGKSDGTWLKLKAVDAWVIASFATETPFLRGINAMKSMSERSVQNFVHPLLEDAKAGDTLLLCPTNSLHRVPLHAIRCGTTPLLSRNPVVYAQSLSLLRLCHDAAIANRPEVSQTRKAVVFNTLGADADESFLHELGSVLSTEPIGTDSFDKKSFESDCAGASIVHIHGHANIEEGTLLEQYFVLREPPESAADKLTANDIFDLRLPRPCIVMAMGCKSGRARISDCNDLLGLTTALHCAGATAVISTLWSVDKDVTAQFSLAFYRYIANALNDEDSQAETINLACAMQHAVLAVRYDERGKLREPYYWAGYTLHGSHLFPRAALGFLRAGGESKDDISNAETDTH